MLALLIVGLAGSVVVFAIAVYAILPGGTYLAGQGFGAALIALGFVALGAITYIVVDIADRPLLRVNLRRVRQEIAAVPLVALIGLAALLVVTAAGNLAALRASPEHSSVRTGTSLVLCVGATLVALAYGKVRLRSRPSLVRPRIPHIVLVGVCGALFVGLVGIVVVSPRPAPSTDDDWAVHNDVDHRFSDEPWRQHLVWVARDHTAYGYHLDTRDEAIVAAVCRSLVPYDKALGLDTNIYFGPDTFIRTCSAA